MRHSRITNQYIVGFVDGEGCFSLTVRRDVRHERKSKAIYYSWKASFVIVLRSDDGELLELIQKYLGCGSVTYTKTSARFQVSDITELYECIVPFFNRNMLLGKKGKDFLLWSGAVKILMKYKKKRGIVNVKQGLRGFQKVAWTKNDISRLVTIQSKIIIYKSRGVIRKWTHQELGRVD